MRLIPNEGLIHDIVTSDAMRGMGVGPFMVSRFTPVLLHEYGATKIIIDVNVKNHASLRMMNKAGLSVDHNKIYVSAFGNLVFEQVLRKCA
jgi:RimJ/RimL family protein N-acetyltransferase